MLHMIHIIYAHKFSTSVQTHQIYHKESDTIQRTQYFGVIAMRILQKQSSKFYLPILVIWPIERNHVALPDSRETLFAIFCKHFLH